MVNRWPATGVATLGLGCSGAEFIESVDGTAGWTYRELYLHTRADQTVVRISARLGHWGNTVAGVARFDDLSFVRLDGLPDAPVRTLAADPPPAPPASTGTYAPQTASPPVGNGWWMLLLLTVVVVAALMRRGRKGDAAPPPAS